MVSPAQSEKSNKHSEKTDVLGQCEEYDVIIIGGGPGGLSCARTLSSSTSSLRVLVLDKSPKVGMKICSGEISSKVFPGVDPNARFKGAQPWKTVTVGTEKGKVSITYDRPFLWTVGRYELETFLKSGCG
ncbi:NAD(P)-binding protein, partial [Candidatus Micrarchaeota archaeon]|nr:NAD(P)-binding protein [Candidatus Micrarchaeota archaeon]